MRSLEPTRCAEFAREAVNVGRAFGLCENGIAVLCLDGQRAAIPFWSGYERAELVRTTKAEYAHFQIREILIPDFLAWLQELESDGNRVCLNLSPDELAERHLNRSTSSDFTPKSVSPAMLQKHLEEGDA